MSTKEQLQKMITALKSNYSLDFENISVNRLKDEIVKAYKNNDEHRSYKLDIASDIKELLTDSHKSEERNFKIDVLLEQFFIA